MPRVVGSAVDRNRLRRRLREILRARDLTPGLYLWGAGEGATALSFADLGQQVDRVLEKANARIVSGQPRKVVKP